MALLGFILLGILIFFFPPLGVVAIAGCGADLLLNIVLTLFGLLPGHIHAYYILYIYYKHRNMALRGITPPPAPGVFSKRVQTGGYRDYR